jgi:hypothetical protein
MLPQSQVFMSSSVSTKSESILAEIFGPEGARGLEHLSKSFDLDHVSILLFISFANG